MTRDTRDKLETLSLLAKVGIIAYFPYVLIPVAVWLSGRYIYDKRNKAQEVEPSLYEQDWIPREEYIAYLKSDDWKYLRNLVFDRDAGICQSCKKQLKRESFSCHHKNYYRLRNELLSDLETLCHRCHSIKHGKLS